MSKKIPKRNRIEEIMADEEAIGKALGEGVRAALRQHKQAGNPIACWRDGKVAILPPDEIPVDDDIVTEERLQELIDRIVATAHPEQVILFGSRARGDKRPDSDIDLLVIQKSTEPRYRRAAPIRRAVAGILPSKDIIVYTPEEVDAWSDVPNAFVTTAVREGRVLYEKRQG